MLKRIYLCLIVCLFSLSLLIGCGNKDDAAESAVKSETVQPADEKQSADAQKNQDESNTPEQKTEAQPVIDEEKIVVTVNSQPITNKALYREIGLEKEFFEAMAENPALNEGNEPPVKPTEEEFKERALEKLIGFELAYQASQKAGFKADPQEVEAALNMMKSNYPDIKDYEEALVKNMMTEAELKYQIEQALAIKDWQEKEFQDKIAVTEEEIKAAYEQYKEYLVKPEQVLVSHILILTPTEEDAGKKAEARKKIEDILAKVKAGQDFAKLAADMSEDQSAKNNQGNLGWIERGMTVKPFEEAAFALKKKGDISPVVETSFGFHIIKLEDRADKGYIPLEEVRQNIEIDIANEKTKALVAEQVQTLKNQAEIKILDPTLLPQESPKN